MGRGHSRKPDSRDLKPLRMRRGYRSATAAAWCQSPAPTSPSLSESRFVLLMYTENVDALLTCDDGRIMSPGRVSFFGGASNASACLSTNTVWPRGSMSRPWDGIRPPVPARGGSSDAAGVEYIEAGGRLCLHVASTCPVVWHSFFFFLTWTRFTFCFMRTSAETMIARIRALSQLRGRAHWRFLYSEVSGRIPQGVFVCPSRAARFWWKISLIDFAGNVFR